MRYTNELVGSLCTSASQISVASQKLDGDQSSRPCL